MTEIVMTQTPPILHGPSEKERKYDRQLRLWAASGQAALESANILLLNSGAGTVGVEALKNLVLPGIGRFTIADAATVQEEDLGVNFFLDDSCLDKPRSQCCTELLLELNPEVKGDWFPKEGPLELDRILATSPTFTMIMYTFPIQPDDLKLLVEYGEQHKTPLVSVHSAGFYSYFRIHLPGAFPIVDTHPDTTATTDLRLLAPWPELVQFARDMTKEIDTLSDHEHGHLPYVVILLHYLDEWRETHNGQYPSNYAEKTEFKKMVAAGARRDNPEGGEENFDEAVAAVVKTLVPPSLPSGLREIFEYQRQEQAEQRSGFWLVAEAIEKFYDKHKCLPLPGSVPDMKAQPGVYIKLQNIYKAKARQDVAEVLEMVQESPRGRNVDPGDVELFCKNAAFVKLINAGRANGARLTEVAQEELAKDENAEAMMMPLSLMPIYLALFATSHQSEASAEEILETIGNIVPGSAGNERLAQAAQEVARAAGGELHNISALTGGMVAQEMIKIITKQYIPIDNTCIFDGIDSRCQILRL
ncbi:NEDD8-activating enzyme E1 regulatory subunit [Pleurostoma richardsiae]|uniref:NEDD8-activating enzyme E1 regulatory subunit n=1 Tax=Pleurostoma richardsiae TaxID=41990 RepID=A0AA38VV73_9PEZI|nr:NEDD8-activating enzyme E1 regulatory subunit [Pleurostoma richardsiae]